MHEVVKTDMLNVTESRDLVICVNPNIHLNFTIIMNIKFQKRRKINLQIKENSLVNKTRDEKVKYLILKNKLTH